MDVAEGYAGAPRDGMLIAMGCLEKKNRGEGD